MLECFEGRHDVLRPPDCERGDLEPERAGCGLHLAHFQRNEGIVDIAHERHPAEIRDDLAQEREPLAGNVGGLERQAGDVAARPRKAGDEAAADGVRHGHKDDRYDRCRLLERP